MYHSDAGGDFGGGIGGLVLLLALVGGFLVVRAAALVVKTFKKYSNTHKSLWIAAAVCGLLSVVGVVLALLVSLFPYILLMSVGMAVLVVTCLIVTLTNKDTFLREHVNIVNEVLNVKSWWGGSEDTPLQEQEIFQMAA